MDDTLCADRAQTICDQQCDGQRWTPLSRLRCGRLAIGSGRKKIRLSVSRTKRFLRGCSLQANRGRYQVVSRDSAGGTPVVRFKQQRLYFSPLPQGQA